MMDKEWLDSRERILARIDDELGWKKNFTLLFGRPPTDQEITKRMYVPSKA